VQTSEKISTRIRSAAACAALRMPSQCLAVALVLVCVTSARAQAPRVDSAGAAAAMERAQRSAANPMRAILQAGKLNTTVRAEVAAAAPRQAAVAPAPATPVAAVVTAAPVPAAAVSVAASSSVLALAKPVEVLYKADPRLNSASANEVQALEAPVPLVAVAEQLIAAAPSAALASSVVTPKLKYRVDPVLPQNVLDQVGQVREVRVNLNINADGSVTDVAVQQPVPRQMVRYVQAAVAQWLFEPLPAARAHQVQLVFSTE
jgi:hypothetical protein